MTDYKSVSRIWKKLRVCVMQIFWQTVYNIFAYECFTWNHQVLTFTNWKSGVSTGQTHQNSYGMLTFIGLFSTGLLVHWLNLSQKINSKEYCWRKLLQPEVQYATALTTHHIWVVSTLCFLLGNIEFELEPLGWLSWGISCFS
jgi:hypothetical protein